MVDKAKENPIINSSNLFSDNMSLDVLKNNIYNIDRYMNINNMNLDFPESIPIPSSKYINNNIHIPNLPGNSIYRIHLIKANGKEYIYENNIYNFLRMSNPSINIEPISEKVKKESNISEESYRQRVTNETRFPMTNKPSFEENVSIEPGDKIKIVLLNKYYDSFLKDKMVYNPSKDRNLYVENTVPAIYEGYYQSDVINVVDHLPYNFGIRLVENQTEGFVNGLAGFALNKVNAINSFYKNPNDTYKQYVNKYYSDNSNKRRNTLSLFIDFSIDYKFMNRYEKSDVFINIENLKYPDGREYMNKGLFNISEHASYSDNYKNIQDGLYSIFSTYNQLLSYNNEVDLHGCSVVPFNFNIGYIYGTNVVDWRNIFQNYGYIYSEKYGDSNKYVPYKKWKEYDITGNMSSYLLGIFPVTEVNGDDVIDYDNPILYRHIIPRNAYNGIIDNDGNKILALKDILDRSINHTFEYDESTKKMTTYKKNTPISSFFYRTNKSPNIFNRENESESEFDNVDTYLGYTSKNLGNGEYINILEGVPKNSNKIAIKIYHSIPSYNVPRLLRRANITNEDTLWYNNKKKDISGTIEKTLYKGQDLSSIFNGDSYYNKNTPYINLLNHHSVPYIYDMTESVLNTKALIIDLNKSDYNNTPLLDKNISLKIYRITENAIYVVTEDEKDEYILDILLNCSKWWFSIPDIVNSNNPQQSFDNTNRNIFPDSIIMIPEYRENDINQYVTIEMSNIKNEYAINKKRKALKLVLDLSNKDKSVSFFSFNLDDDKSMNDDSLAYYSHHDLFSIAYNDSSDSFNPDNMLCLNFSMSNNFFSNDNELDYSKIEYLTKRKEFIKEVDGQFIFISKSYRDINKQLLNNWHKRYTDIHQDYIDYGANDIVLEGSSEIIYTIGLTPNTFNKLKYKNRVYKKSYNDDTYIKEYLNDFNITSNPLKSVNKKHYISLHKGDVIDSDIYNLLRRELDDKKILSFPINLNEMTEEEIRNIFPIITEKLVSDYDLNNNDIPHGDVKQGFVYSSSYKILKDIKIYYKSYNLTYLLLYYILKFKIKGFKSFNRSGSSDIMFNIGLESIEERYNRLKEFFKKAEEVNGQVILSDSNNRYANLIEQYTQINDVNAITNCYYESNTNDIITPISKFMARFDMNWLFVYTPKLNPKIDNVIAEILYKSIINFNNQLYSLYNEFYKLQKNNMINYSLSDILNYLFDTNRNIYSISNNRFKSSTKKELYMDLYNNDRTGMSPLYLYKDIIGSSIDVKNNNTYREFKKTDIKNTYVDNPFMGRVIDYTEYTNSIPEDTRAVLVTLSFISLQSIETITPQILQDNCNIKIEVLEEYSRKCIPVIFNILVDNVDSNKYSLSATNYTDEFGTGIGYGFNTENKISNDYTDVKNQIDKDTLNQLYNGFKKISNNLISTLDNVVIDGINFNMKNWLINMMNFKETSSDEKQKYGAVKLDYRLTNYEKHLMKKGVVFGYNIIIFPDTLDKFKDVLDNNFDDILYILNKDTVKYYKIGNYDIPDEYLEKWNKIKNKIGYRIALHNVYHHIDNNDNTKVLNNAPTMFSLDLVTLTRCGIYHTQKRTEQSLINYDKVNLFSNLNKKMTMTVELDILMKYDNSKLLTMEYNTNTNGKATNIDTNKISDLNRINELRNPINFRYNHQSIPVTKNTVNLINKFWDFSKVSLSTNKTNSNGIILLDDITVRSNIISKEKRIDDNTNTYVNEISSVKESANVNVFSTSGFSLTYTKFKLRIDTVTGSLPEKHFIHFSNFNNENRDGVIINDYSGDVLFPNF